MTPRIAKLISVASISKEEFCVTAILVAILWCILGIDRIIPHGAQADSASAHYKIEYLQMRSRFGVVESPLHPAAPEPAPISVALHEI
jgi:hypothetical protein